MSNQKVSSTIIRNPDANGIGLTVRGAVGQTAGLQEWQDFNGNILARIASTGTLNMSSGSYFHNDGRLFSVTGNPGLINIIARGATSQTANLQEWQNGAGTVLGSMSPSGFMTTSNGFRAPFFSLSGSVGPILDFSTVSNSLLVTQRTSGAVGMAVRGAASQSANLQEWQNDSGVAQSWIDNTGLNLFVSSVRPRSTPTTGAFLALNSNQAQITQQTAGAVAFIIRGAASQTANLQEWQNSAGSILSRIESSGNAQFPIAGVGATALNSLGGTFRVMNAGAAAVGITVRGAASQTANLTEWQDSGGSLLAWANASGAFTALQYSTINSQGRIAEASSGAFLRLGRMTAQAASPGNNLGSLYFRDGTNAGTLKLVVIAGAAGAETTILDNIPQ